MRRRICIFPVVDTRPVSANGGGCQGVPRIGYGILCGPMPATRR